MMMSFAHLHVRTGYSFFQSMIQIDPLVEQANKLNMSALALTDDRVLYGVIPFYKACLKHGIKPIIGLHVHVTIHEDLVPCTLLAKTNLSYEHIMKISTQLQMEDDLTEAVLKSLSDDVGCIISSQYEPFKRELLVGESRHLTGVL